MRGEHGEDLGISYETQPEIASFWARFEPNPCPNIASFEAQNLSPCPLIASFEPTELEFLTFLTLVNGAKTKRQPSTSNTYSKMDVYRSTQNRREEFWDFLRFFGDFFSIHVTILVRNSVIQAEIIASFRAFDPGEVPQEIPRSWHKRSMSQVERQPAVRGQEKKLGRSCTLTIISLMCIICNISLLNSLDVWV